jgi:hypothetical protein
VDNETPEEESDDDNNNDIPSYATFGKTQQERISRFQVRKYEGGKRMPMIVVLVVVVVMVVVIEYSPTLGLLAGRHRRGEAQASRNLHLLHRRSGTNASSGRRDEPDPHFRFPR